MKLDAGTVHVRQKTNYPWEGVVTIYLDVDQPIDFSLKLRVPGWTGDGPFASDLYRFTPPAQPLMYGVHDVQHPLPKDGWHVIEQRWTKGSFVVLRLPMPARRITANPGVKDDAGKAAIQRGPVLYVLEGVDNGGKVLDLSVPMTTTFTSAVKPDLLGGVTVLTATLPAVGDTPARTITAVPYFAWANRGRGEMVTWIKQ